MDTGRYLPLLTVDVEHAYFPDGLCRGLRFVPVGDGVQRFEAAGGLVRETARGVAVYGDGEARDALRLLVADASEPLSLAWSVHADDPAFINYTEGLVRQGEGVLAFDGAQAVEEGEGVWRLQAEARDAEPGLGRLPPFARIHLGLDASAFSETPRLRRYRLPLQARATVWKYCLFGDWGSDAMQIVDLANETEFDAPAPEQLVIGRTALAIRSRGRIALQERSERRFQLRGRSAGTDKVLVKRLPVAGASLFCREIIAGVPTLVSEIFVHR